VKRKKLDRKHQDIGCSECGKRISFSPKPYGRGSYFGKYELKCECGTKYLVKYSRNMEIFCAQVVALCLGVGVLFFGDGSNSTLTIALSLFVIIPFMQLGVERERKVVKFKNS